MRNSRGGPRRRTIYDHQPVRRVTMTLGDDVAAHYYGGGELGLSLKPPRWLRKMKPLKALGSVVQSVAPLAVGFVPGGNELMAAFQAATGGAAAEAGGLPMAAGAPSIAALSASNPAVGTAMQAAMAAMQVAQSAEQQASAQPGNAQLRTQAQQKRSLAERLQKFAEDLYREVAHRSVQLGRTAEAAGRALEAGAEAVEHGGRVISRDPAPGISGIVNLPAWAIGAGVGLGGIVLVKLLSGGRD